MTNKPSAVKLISQGDYIMARGNKQPIIETYKMSEYPNGYVCQSNDLANTKQNLKLNSAKLVRAAIMQISKDDIEIKPYLLTIKEMSTLLGISESNLYRDAKLIAADIIQNPIYIQKEEHGKSQWTMMPWVKLCSYDSDVGFIIQLNDLLMPYLIGLKGQYEQYNYENILAMKSPITIRVFELIQSGIFCKVLPKDGVDVQMTVEHIRECLDCETKYTEFSNFRARVIDAAIKEINSVTLYHITYEVIKTGRVASKIKFHVNMQYH